MSDKKEKIESAIEKEAFLKRVSHLFKGYFPKYSCSFSMYKGTNFIQMDNNAFLRDGGEPRQAFRSIIDSCGITYLDWDKDYDLLYDSLKSSESFIKILEGFENEGVKNEDYIIFINNYNFFMKVKKFIHGEILGGTRVLRFLYSDNVNYIFEMLNGNYFSLDFRSTALTGFTCKLYPEKLIKFFGGLGIDISKGIIDNKTRNLTFPLSEISKLVPESEPPIAPESPNPFFSESSKTLILSKRTDNSVISSATPSDKGDRKDQNFKNN